MSQHDYNIANAGGAAVRSDMNNALAAIQSLNSGATAPTATKPFMPWYDTATGALKFRNAADTGWMSGLQAVGGTQSVNFRNRLINGDHSVDQRNSGASQTVTAGSTAYSLDRWIVYTSGSNITSQRVGAIGSYSHQITGAAGNTSSQVIQRIEAINIADLAGQSVTLSVVLSSSTLTSVGLYVQTPTASDNYASTNTIVTISAVTISSTATKYTYTFTMPATATNGAQIIIQTGAFTSGTLTIGDIQLESGAVDTPMERRPHGMELALCQRYFESIPNLQVLAYWQSTTAGKFGVQYAVPKRASASITYSSGSFLQQSNAATFASGSNTSLGTVTLTQYQNSVMASLLDFTNTVAATTGFAFLFSPKLFVSAEL